MTATKVCALTDLDGEVYVDPNTVNR